VGDDVGLARAWRRIAFAQRREGAFGAAAEASERALEHAGRAGDAREKGRIVDGLCSALLFGPTAAPLAIERCEQLLDGSDAQPSLVAAVYSSLAGLLAMQERFDEARDVYARAKGLWEELGLRYAVAGLTQVGADVEMLAGDPVAAERELRIGAEILADVGGSPVQSALLARALLAQGRLDEAATLALDARDRAGGEVSAEVLGDLVVAVVTARGSRTDDAIQVAERAVRRARGMERPNLQADALDALASCLAEAGRPEEAAAAREEALRLYDAKGNVASARRLAGRVA
jgi:tetratricopeptide (TPR) repeat protein